MKLFFFLAASALAQDRNPLRSDPAAVEAGRQTFLGACSACHGANGEGGQGPNLVTGRQIGRLTDRQLFRSIKDGLPGTDMPPFRLPDDKVWQLVSFVRGMSAPAVSMQLPGDAARGAAIFSGKGGCAGCHRIRGSGGALGPDLTNIGALRTVHLLRQSVLEPNTRIEPGFEAITCVDRNGAEIRGVAKNRNNYSLQVLDRAGRLHLLAPADLKSVKMAEKSLMPDDFATRLTKTEIDDLIAFLSRQSARPFEGESQ